LKMLGHPPVTKIVQVTALIVLAAAVFGSMGLLARIGSQHVRAAQAAEVVMDPEVAEVADRAKKSFRRQVDGVIRLVVTCVEQTGDDSMFLVSFDAFLWGGTGAEKSRVWVERRESDYRVKAGGFARFSDAPAFGASVRNSRVLAGGCGHLSDSSRPSHHDSRPGVPLYRSSHSQRVRVAAGVQPGWDLGALGVS